MGVSPNVDPVRPDDLTATDLPTAMRGYERGAVERLLARAANGLLHVGRERDRLRGLVEEVTRRADAAEGEARVIAGQLVDLNQRVSTVEAERDEARARVAELEEALARARPASATAEAAAPPSPAPAPPPEAAAGELLVAAVRTAGEIRASARDAAQRLLRKARGRAAEAEAEAERQAQRAAAACEREAEARAAAERHQAALAAALAERQAAEREAEEIRAAARAEAARTLGAVGEERERMRTLLAGALEALGAGGDGDLVSDLSGRLAQAQGDGSAPVPEQSQG